MDIYKVIEIMDYGVAYLRRDKANLFYEVHGQGPALLLTHGFAADSGMWRGQVERFSQNNTLIVWDMRGHGRTQTPVEEAAYSEAETTKDMSAILDHTGFETAVIGGLSLGGYMSLAFHADFASRVESLLIIDTGPGYKSLESRAKWNHQANKMADVIAEQGLQALQSGSPEISQSRHSDKDALVRAGRHMLTQHNDRVIQSLPDIGVPTLLVAGANDEPYLAGIDYMANKIPSATKCIIPDAGHAVNIDQPELFNHAVIKFLEENGMCGR